MMRPRCWLVAVGVALLLVTAVEAKTIAWYHFDEGNVGDYATTAMQITNSVDATKLLGTPGTRGTGVDDTYLPKFVDEFASYTYLVDPVANTTNANHRALNFKRGDASEKLPGRLGGYVQVASDASLSLTTFTVEFFVRTTQDTTQWVAKRNGSGIGNFTYSICLNNNKPYVNMYTLADDGSTIELNPNTGASKFISGTTVTDGKWHHVALTVDSTGDKASAPEAKLYVDYALTGDKHTTNLSAPILNVDSGDKGALYLGASSMGYYTPAGTLDEVRISDAVLTPDKFLRWTNVTNPDLAIRLSFDDAYDYTLNADALYSVSGQTIFNQGADGDFAITTSSASNGAKPTWENTDLPFSQFYRGVFSSETSATVNLGALDMNVTEGTTRGLSFKVVDDHEIISDSFTMECSFKMQSDPTQAVYFFKQDWLPSETNKTFTALQVYVNSGDKKLMAFGRNSDNGKCGESLNVTLANVCDGQWHHVGAVYDNAAETFSLYLDRTNVATMAFKTGTSGAASTYPLYMLGSASERQFDALVDEYVITRRALKPAEFVIPQRETTTRLYVDFENNVTMQPGAAYLTNATVTASYADRVPGEHVQDCAGATPRDNTRSVYFDGTSKTTVKFPHTDVIELPSMTVEFFMRYEDADGYAALARFNQSNANYNTTPIWNIGFANDTATKKATEVSMRVDTTTKGNQGHNFGTSFMDGRWHHLAVTFERQINNTGSTTNTLIKMYDTTYSIMSRQTTTTQVGGDWTVPGELCYTNGSALGLGTSSMSRYFKGNIDEFRISKGVLETSQFMKWSKNRRGLGIFYK